MLDLTMPRMSGREAFDEIRLLEPGARVVVTSGYSREEAIGRFGTAGPAGFVQKPFNPEEMISTLRRVLERQHAAGA